jgi:monoamine oxidase
MRYAIGDSPHALRARAPETVSGRRMIIVGAGLGGLACAEQLVRAGVDVLVLEATHRVGGRVRAIRDLVPGAVLEMGAEFVGKNHPLWISYANRFGIPLIQADAFPDRDKPLLLDGVRVSKDDAEPIWKQADALLRRLNILALGVDADQPWQSPAADELDHLSLCDWIDAQTDVSEQARTVAKVGMAGDNGVDCERQSLLANLAMIKGGGMDRFWDESEYFRAQGGNERLALALYRAVGEDRVRFNSPVKKITRFDDAVVVETQDGSRYVADDVVLATPATAYAKITFDPPLPEELEVQMGRTLKFLAHVSKDFWRKDHYAPEGLSDGLVSQMWTGTDNQPGAQGTSLNALCLPSDISTAAAVGRD